jgi:putative flippase GtrA
LSLRIPGFSVANLRFPQALSSTMDPAARLLDPSQIRSFLGVGAIATAVHYLVLVAAVQAFGIPPVPSALLGYCCGGALSYHLNRTRTFGSDRPHGEAVWRFAAVALVGFALTLLFMSVLVDGWRSPYLLAQGATTGTVMVWNYTANRFWTFSTTGGR